MRDATKIIRPLLARTVPGEPLHAGLVVAVPYHTPGGDAIAEGFIRMSARCESIENLVEGVAQALGAAR